MSSTQTISAAAANPQLDTDPAAAALLHGVEPMRGYTDKHLLERFYSERATIGLYSSGGTLHTVKIAWDSGQVERRSFRGAQAARKFIQSQLETK